MPTPCSKTWWKGARGSAATHLRKHAAFLAERRRNGQFAGGNRLQPARTAKTLRVRHGQVSVTDGPWIETKEQLGGYYLIDANDVEEAIRIAAKIPTATFGYIEVRPVADNSGTVQALR